jgi:hypothetical protein
MPPLQRLRSVLLRAKASEWKTTGTGVKLAPTEISVGTGHLQALPILIYGTT